MRASDPHAVHRRNCTRVISSPWCSLLCSTFLDDLLRNRNFRPRIYKEVEFKAGAVRHCGVSRGFGDVFLSGASVVLRVSPTINRAPIFSSRSLHPFSFFLRPSFSQGFCKSRKIDNHDATWLPVHRRDFLAGIPLSRLSILIRCRSVVSGVVARRLNEFCGFLSAGHSVIGIPPGCFSRTFSSFNRRKTIGVGAPHSGGRTTKCRQVFLLSKHGTTVWMIDEAHSPAMISVVSLTCNGPTWYRWDFPAFFAIEQYRIDYCRANRGFTQEKNDERNVFVRFEKSREFEFVSLAICIINFYST